jgi:hypothetical protein
MKRHTYRISPIDKNILFEFIAGTSMPTGRVFKKSENQENEKFKETVKIKDGASGEIITYVFSHLA